MSLDAQPTQPSKPARRSEPVIDPSPQPTISDQALIRLVGGFAVATVVLSLLLLLINPDVRSAFSRAMAAGGAAGPARSVLGGAVGIGHSWAVREHTAEPSTPGTMAPTAQPATAVAEPPAIAMPAPSAPHAQAAPNPAPAPAPPPQYPPPAPATPPQTPPPTQPPSSTPPPTPTPTDSTPTPSSSTSTDPSPATSSPPPSP